MGSNPSTSVKSITWEQQKIKKPLEKSIVPYVDSERLSHKHHQKQTPTTQNDTVTQYVTLRHDLAWPLPPDPVYESFTINDSPDSHDYQLLPISPRVSTPMDVSIGVVHAKNKKTETKESYAKWTKQTDVTANDMTWKKQFDSQIVGDAHVQSQLSTRFEAACSLSSAENLEFIVESLKHTQKRLDENLRVRLAKISSHAEEKIVLAATVAQDERRQLLLYDRKCQEQQEQIYQEWLQKYVTKLNAWRATQLATLQTRIGGYHYEIIRKYNSKINSINEQVNTMQTIILEEEKSIATNRTMEVTRRMYKKDSQHLLGSESKFEANLRIQANAGMK